MSEEVEKLRNTIGRTEILEETPSEKLLDYLLKCGCDVGHFSKAKIIFNSPFEIGPIFDYSKEILKEEIAEFEQHVEEQVIILDGIEFLHLSSIGKDKVERGKVTRRFRKLNMDVLKPSHLQCPEHKFDCNLVTKSLGLLLFLYLKVDMSQGKLSEQDSASHGLESCDSVVTLTELEKQDLDTEEVIDYEAEKQVMSAGLDVALFKAQTIIEDYPEEKIEISDSSLTIPTLPFFNIQGKNFILIADIQKLFNLREDYCLAIIAEGCEVAHGFIDVENEPSEEFLALDTETSSESFIPAESALSLCVRKALDEKPSLKDEDFEERLEQLGVANFGREILIGNEPRLEKDGTVNLWKEKLVKEDETIKIELTDADNFLGRGIGSRVGAEKESIKRDSALAHYLPSLDKDVFIVFHGSFSENAEIALFTLKVMSRFMGFSPIQANANKVMLLERTAAIRIFGYAPGFNTLRSSYFLCYSSYALADKKTDVKFNSGYNRKKFLRYRGDMPEHSSLKRLKK